MASYQAADELGNNPARFTGLGGTLKYDLQTMPSLYALRECMFRLIPHRSQHRSKQQAGPLLGHMSRLLTTPLGSMRAWCMPITAQSVVMLELADDFEAFMEDRQNRLLALIEMATGKTAYSGTAAEEGEDVEFD